MRLQDLTGFQLDCLCSQNCFSILPLDMEEPLANRWETFSDYTCVGAILDQIWE